MWTLVGARVSEDARWGEGLRSLLTWLQPKMNQQYSGDKSGHTPEARACAAGSHRCAMHPGSGCSKGSGWEGIVVVGWWLCQHSIASTRNIVVVGGCGGTVAHSHNPHHTGGVPL